MMMTASLPAIRRALVALGLCVLALALLGGVAGAQSGDGPPVYERDAINAGLPGEPPGYYDTPQATMESFHDAAEREDWTAAAHALDLGFLPPDQQARAGPRLARQFHAVLGRAMTLDWDALPDRPDALDDTSSSKNPMAGVPRRDIRLGRIDMPTRAVTVRIARYRAGDGDPRWLIAGQTVQNLSQLYERYGPTAFEQALPDMLRQPAFWTLLWWEVIALPFVIAVAFLAAALTWRALRTLSDRYGDKWIVGVLDAVRTPVALFAFAGTFAVMRQLFFTFSGPIAAILDPVQILAIVLAIASIFLAVIEGILDTVAQNQIDDISEPEAERDRNYYTTLSAVRRIVIVILLLVAIGVVLIQTNLTETLGFSLVASAGFLTLILAFAARTMLSDVMASLQIAFSKTARIGDAVKYDGSWSYVEKIGFTHLRLRTWDERRVLVPVGEFVQSSFENWTKTDPYLMEVARLHLDHRADIAKLREEFAKFVADDDDAISPEEAKLQVVDHTDRAMVVRMIVRATDPSTGWDMLCRLREHMLRMAARMDAAAGAEPAPAFLPREREVRMDENAAGNGDPAQ
ncbi:mechanosensitive ion channel family protein [Croceicoccus sp. YJ47]|uniref:mechanosensitive ion channel family protein n=1 Tax=Croceicoccus sp. YJ47 TaxID=2798724 RepID=UPI00192235E3|nr:mechanosensitive ion channel domain-containing protein [Croceicoccus sp. YJ47]QQN74560.1 mechanosensitive ion channel [Croceicoccus sp. YJ47]